MLQTNCYLLIDGGEAAVVDPGDEARKIIDEVGKTGAKVKFIINTHNHFDHIGANGELKKKFNAKIMIHGKDDTISADSCFKEGDIISVGNESLKVVETPGHTAGGVCLFCNGFVISGDTLFDQGVGRVDLPGGSIADMRASLAKLEKMIPPGTKIYPGHGEIFTFEKGEIQKWI